MTMLYLSRMFGCFFSEGCWDKKTKLNNLYNQAEKKIEENLDLLNIVGKLRQFDILLENTMMTD
jgi:hypothetical protein